MSFKIQKLATLLFLFSVLANSAQAESVKNISGFFSSEGRIVTHASYPTDETSRQMLQMQSAVGINQLVHKRKLAPTDDQSVVRMNRDTYYSMGVVDVSEGATITLPATPEGKYMSFQPVTEDHRIQPMSYGSGTYELATHTGTHLMLIVRLDGTFTAEEAAGYQDRMLISAKSDKMFSTKPIEQKSFERVENELKAKTPMLVKRDGILAMRGGFTAPTDESRAIHDEEKYQVMAAGGWGGAQWKDNIYEVSGEYKSDVCHQAKFEDPENGAFWSFTVYNGAGFMFDDVANVSSNTATMNVDETFTVSFGCDEQSLNNIPTTNDTGVFTLTVRHYQPSERVRDQGYRLLPFVKPL